MQKETFIAIIIAAVAFAPAKVLNSHLTNVESDPEMEKYLREAVENFREQMKVGISAINMPPLDPLNLQNLDINVNENLATMSLKIKQVTVQYLSLFNITDMKSNLDQLYLSVNLTLPKLDVHGFYIVDGKFVKIFPIYGSGRFEINASEICIAGKGKLHFINGTLEMNTLKLDLLWKNITVFLENFLGGGNFSEVLQRVVAGVGKDVFDAYKPLILDKLEQGLMKKVNDKLKDPVVRDIIEGIYPDPSEYDQ